MARWATNALYTTNAILIGTAGVFDSGLPPVFDSDPPPFVPTWVCSDTAAVSAADGSSEAPYIICDCDDLENISNDLSAHYVLGQNIDCTPTTGWDSGAGFTPIGNFGGNLNGQFFTISNLFMYRPAQENVGLFATLDDSTIQYIHNMTLHQVNITGRRNVGGLIGMVELADVEMVHITGSVTGLETDFLESTNTGGITGGGGLWAVIRSSSFSGTITTHRVSGGIMGVMSAISSMSDVSADVTIIAGANTIGGLVGNHLAGVISSSYASGSITGTFRLGGIAGESRSNIQHTQADVDITGTNNIGGIAGSLEGGIPRMINTTSSGTLQGDSFIGGIIGYIYRHGFATNSTFQGTIQATDPRVGGIIGGISFVSFNDIDAVVEYETSTWYNNTADDAIYCVGHSGDTYPPLDPFNDCIIS